MGKFASNILRTANVGKHTEEGGLQLRVSSIGPDGSRKGSWYFRYSFQGQQYEIGLGSIKTTSLKQAREKKDYYSELMADRRNPINPRDEKRRLAEIARGEANIPNLMTVTQLAFEARKASLKGDGKSGRWLSPLEHHVLPILGKKQIDQISQTDICRALRPIWKEKAPTAQKALQRLGIVLRHARAMGLDVNPHVVSDARELLGATGHEVKHYPALPPSQARRMFQALNLDSVSNRALAFYTLVGAGPRIGPVLKMKYEQIENGVWTIPAGVMKGLRGKTPAFRVPMTPRMAQIVEISRSQTDPSNSLVFPTPQQSNAGEKAISDQAVENVMRRFQDAWEWQEPYRLHGIRATFKTWASERDPANHTVVETSLGHVVGNAVERSYQRSDFLEERRLLLTAWGDFLGTEC